MLLKSFFTYKKISEGCSFLSGYAFKSKNFSDVGIPVVKIKNIQNKKADFKSSQFFPKSLYQKKLDKFKVYHKDILIAMTGQGSVGRVGQLKINESKFGLLNQRVGKFICDEETLNRDFLFYILSSNRYQEHLFDKAIGSGQPNLSPTDIIDTEIPFPEFEEQKAIASILSSLDDKIELNLQMNKTLESMAMALYKHWFVDFGPFRDGEFVDSELGKIPEGWEVKKLSSLANFKNGKGLKKEFRKEDGKNNVFGSNGVIGKTDEYTFDTPVIAIGRVGANYGEVHYSIYKCWISDNAVTAQPLNQKYYWWLLQRLRLIDYSNFVAGSAQPLITQGAIKDINCVVPNEDLLNDFSLRLDFLFSQLQNNLLENQTLIKLRDTLLPKLISGEVRVKDIASRITEVL